MIMNLSQLNQIKTNLISTKIILKKFEFMMKIFTHHKLHYFFPIVNLNNLKILIQNLNNYQKKRIQVIINLKFKIFKKKYLKINKKIKRLIQNYLRN